MAFELRRHERLLFAADLVITRIDAVHGISYCSFELHGDDVFARVKQLLSV